MDAIYATGEAVSGVDEDFRPPLQAIKSAADDAFREGNTFVSCELDAALAAIAELIAASQEMRSILRTTLAVNCKCDDEFIDAQTHRIDAALAACKPKEAQS
jgi:hypothetical protein